MVLDDVYAELAHNHDVPLQDLDATTLGTVLALLQKSRKEREDYQEYRVKTDQKVASASVIHLPSLSLLGRKRAFEIRSGTSAPSMPLRRFDCSPA